MAGASSRRLSLEVDLLDHPDSRVGRRARALHQPLDGSDAWDHPTHLHQPVLVVQSRIEVVVFFIVLLPSRGPSWPCTQRHTSIRQASLYVANESRAGHGAYPHERLSWWGRASHASADSSLEVADDGQQRGQVLTGLQTPARQARQHSVKQLEVDRQLGV